MTPCVVIPAFNHAKALPGVIAGALAHCPVIVVDDGSTDNPVVPANVTLVRFEIPVGVSDPVERMRLIGARCRALRHERAIPHSNGIAAVLNLLPVSVTGGMLKHVDFLASNVPGFGAEVYVAGARVDAFYPFGPTLGSAVNFTLMSHSETCNIGINTDAGAVPDPERLVAAVRESFAEVLAVGADAASPPTAS